jgi:DNA-binding CsgD family transcriptional regulator
VDLTTDGREPPALSSELLGSALEGLCVGFVTLDGTTRVAWMNRAAQATLGLDLGEVRGLPFAQVLRDPQLTAFWHAALQSELTTMSEVTLHWPRTAHLKVNATVARSPAGDVIGRALLFCDVTTERQVQVALSQEATERLMDLATGWNESAEAKAALTPQELRVLRLLGQGLSNVLIAQAMEVAPSTVRSHLKSVYAKLGLGSRSEAISYALRNGLA